MSRSSKHCRFCSVEHLTDVIFWSAGVWSGQCDGILISLSSTSLDGGVMTTIFSTDGSSVPVYWPAGVRCRQHVTRDTGEERRGRWKLEPINCTLCLLPLVSWPANSSFVLYTVYSITIEGCMSLIRLIRPEHLTWWVLTQLESGDIPRVE